MFHNFDIQQELAIWLFCLCFGHVSFARNEIYERIIHILNALCTKRTNPLRKCDKSHKQKSLSDTSEYYLC